MSYQDHPLKGTIGAYTIHTSHADIHGITRHQNARAIVRHAARTARQCGLQPGDYALTYNHGTAIEWIASR